MKQFPIAIRIWLLSFALCAVATKLAFAHADIRLAKHFLYLSNRLNGLGEALGSAVILSAETATVLVLVLARLWRGHLPPAGKALAVACLASICAYGIDNNVLKVYFGVPSPVEALNGARHAFNFWQGTKDSSFPSGHMVLAGAFCRCLHAALPGQHLAAHGFTGLSALLEGLDWRRVHETREMPAPMQPS